MISLRKDKEVNEKEMIVWIAIIDTDSGKFFLSSFLYAYREIGIHEMFTKYVSNIDFVFYSRLCCI